MDLHKACNILHIEIHDINDKKKVKKAYHRQALRHHPDKNRNNTSSNSKTDCEQAFRYSRSL